MRIDRVVERCEIALDVIAGRGDEPGGGGAGRERNGVELLSADLQVAVRFGRVVGMDNLPKIVDAIGELEEANIR